MDQWQNLYDRFAGIDRERRHRERVERLRRDALLAFDDWCARAVDRALDQIQAALSIRAQDFEKCTRCAVEVLYPASAPISAPPQGPFMTFLHLRAARSQVHLYSHRLSGAWPLLHMILVAGNAHGAPPSLRDRTLITLPSCMIVQHADLGHDFRRVAPADPDRDGRPMSLDEVVYRCFELLVDGLRRAT